MKDSIKAKIGCIVKEFTPKEMRELAKQLHGMAERIRAISFGMGSLESRKAPKALTGKEERGQRELIKILTQDLTPAQRQYCKAEGIPIADYVKAMIRKGPKRD